MKPQVLFVDDEKLMRWSVAQALPDSGFDVELAASGEEAIEKVKQHKFDLVISDLKMDGLNGIEVVKQVRQFSPETKLLMVSAYGNEEDINSAKNAGISGWLNKPFEMDYLIEQVNKILEHPNSKPDEEASPLHSDSAPVQKSNTPKSKSKNNGMINFSFMVLWLLGLGVLAPLVGAAVNSPPAYRATFLYVIQDAGSKFNKLRTPSSLFFDTRNQELYVVDLGTKRILSFDTNGVAVQEWHNFGKLKNPGSVVVDSRGNLYVGDAVEPLIVILNYFGKIDGYLDLSSIVTTNLGSKHDSADNKFRIHKLLIDKNNQLYIGDNQGNRIVVIDTFTGQLLRTLCDSEETKITSLTDMVLDDWGNLVVLDGGRNQVMLMTSQGELLRAFGKSGGSAYTLGFASGVSYVPQQKWFLVTDATRHNVLVYDQNGECIYEFGGLGTKLGWFYFPRGVAVDNNEHIYVLEPNQNRIQVFQINQSAVGSKQ